MPNNAVRQYRVIGITAVLCIIYAFTVRYTPLRIPCLFHEVTGLKCPGCGMTRSVVCFALGQFSRGWQYSPLGIFWLLLALYFCIARYLLGKPAKGLLPAAGVLIGLMIVFYLYRMYRFFPGEVPMEYTRGNLLERVIPGYFGLLQEMLGRLRALGAAYFG